MKVFFYLACLSLCAHAQTSNSIDFTEITGDIINPERGWFDPISFSEGESSYQEARQNKMSLVWVKIRADNYRSKPFDKSFLDMVEKIFNYSRNQGVKIIPRVIYNHSAGGADAPLEMVLQHIEQLKPIYHKHSDVISVLDPGFIGNWGEWHSSSNGLTESTKRNAIVKALLGMIPKDRMMYIRYPHQKLDYLAGKFTARQPWLDSNQAFNGTDMARIGHLNDCMFYDNSDRGTYQQGIDRKFGLEYIGQESAFVPYGGETCGNAGTQSSCSNVLKEMGILQINHLNSGFDKSVYSRWKSEGCYDEVTRRFGYRFVLKNAQHTASVVQGGTLDLKFSIQNTGFGKLYNPRPVNVVLIRDDGVTLTAKLSTDPRRWSAGKLSTISVKLSIPLNTKEGKYSIALGLPDEYESLKNDARYAVRFANNNVWDEKRGLNMISQNLVITKTIANNAPNQVPESQMVFKEVWSNAASPIINNKASLPYAMYNVTYLPGLKQIYIANIPNTIGHFGVEVYDINGKIIFQQTRSIENKEIFIPAPALQKGLYMVRLEVQGQIITRKVQALP
jgi:Domain of unknown function (DUF4832)/Domain of unknown function (DUF4874)/Secretion system C-terminal sorting domain